MYEDYFAERMAALRNEKNISAREMSLAIGQNASYINRIENKQTFPSMQAFFYICEYLKITPDEFFNTDLNYPTEIKEIIHILNTLEKKDFTTIYNLIKLLKE